MNDQISQISLIAQTSLIDLIQDGDESAYRQEVKEVAVCCSLKNQELNKELNTLKTVYMILPQELLKKLYSAIIEFVICTSITPCGERVTSGGE